VPICIPSHLGGQAMPPEVIGFGRNATIANLDDAAPIDMGAWGRTGRACSDYVAVERADVARRHETVSVTQLRHFWADEGRLRARSA